MGDGRVKIDNNLVENAIRPTAVGKKNWLSSAMRKRANAARLSTPSLRAAGGVRLIPTRILGDVLTRLPTMTNRRIPEVTPEAWAKARRTDVSSKAS